MVNVSIARRYARALLEASGAAADQVLAELHKDAANMWLRATIFKALCEH